MGKKNSPRDLQSRYQSELVKYNGFVNQIRELESKKEKIRSIPEIASHFHDLARNAVSKCPPPVIPTTHGLGAISREAPPSTTPTGGRITTIKPWPDSAVGKGLSAIKALDKEVQETTVLLHQSREKLALMEVEATTQGVDLPPMQVPERKENAEPSRLKGTPEKAQESKALPPPDLQKATENEEEEAKKTAKVPSKRDRDEDVEERRKLMFTFLKQLPLKNGNRVDTKEKAAKVLRNSTHRHRLYGLFDDKGIPMIASSAYRDFDEWLELEMDNPQDEEAASYLVKDMQRHWDRYWNK